MEQLEYEIDNNAGSNYDYDIGSTVHIVSLFRNFKRDPFYIQVVRYEEVQYDAHIYAHLVYAPISKEDIQQVHEWYNVSRELKGSLIVFNDYQKLKNHILNNPAEFV